MQTFFDLLNQNSSIKTLSLRILSLKVLTEEDWRILSDILSGFSFLESLDFSWNLDYSWNNDNNLATVACKKFGGALVQCKSLKNLNLARNRLKSLNLETWKEFGNLLLQYKSLTSLNFTKNFNSRALNINTLKKLYIFLRKRHTLKIIHLGELCAMSKEQFKTLFKLIKNHPNDS